MSARHVTPRHVALPAGLAFVALVLGLDGFQVGAAAPAASSARRADALRVAPSAAGSPLADGGFAEQVPIAPEESGIDKALLRQAPSRAKSALPPYSMTCNDLSLVLDGFGGFGSASAGGDAFFDAGTGHRATVFEAMAHLRGAGYLDADSLTLPQSAAGSSRDGDAVIASYVRGPFRFDLRSTLVDCIDSHSGALVQEWTITNVSTRDQNLGFSVYVDGDLFFEGDHRDDFGVLAEDSLWQFDQPGTDAPAAYLKLTSEAPLAPVIIRQVGEYSDQRRRINRNEVLNGGLWRSTGANADVDGDGVTDVGFDVSLALGHEFGAVAPGVTVGVNTRLEWGVGTLADAIPQELAVSLGDDRVIECQGHEGSLVSLAGMLEPADPDAAWSWSIDGLPVAGAGPEISALLPRGTHDVSVVVTDSRGAIAADSLQVHVLDSIPPEVEIDSEILLWPPDHRLVPLDLPILVRDGCSEAPLVRVVSIDSNEPDEVGRGGDGHFTSDAAIIGGQAWVRRERQGGGEDRIYLVHCEVVDEAGHVVPVTVTARVPHDRH